MPPNTSVPVSYTDPNASETSMASPIERPPSVSRADLVVSGLKTTVYGLAELDASVQQVACLWMLHPRLQTQECMLPFAAQFIKNWTSTPESKRRGLIAVSFDQRNHGSREVSPIANEAWNKGNETHAQDMFSSFHGTSTDTSQLLDHIEAYIFPATDDKRKIVQNIVFGISLGGHASWHVLMQDPRFSAAIVTIGCPDYTRLMADRARLSKRKTWHESQGRSFVGSTDFPDGLVRAVRQYDPAGSILGTLLEISPGRIRGDAAQYTDLTDDEKVVLSRLLGKIMGNKRIINLSGGADKLVPYAMGKPFLDWLKATTSKDGCFSSLGIHLEDVIIPDAGHEVPMAMVPHMERFLFETLKSPTTMDANKLGSKI